MTKAPAVRKKTTKVSAGNVIDDPAQSLQTFDLLDLQLYTQEKVYSTTASKDFHLFYVGRDDRSVPRQRFALSEHVRV